MCPNQVRLDYGYCMAKGLGGAPGLSPEELAKLGKDSNQAVEAAALDREAGKLGFWDLPNTPGAELGPILAEADRLKHVADTLVVLGIGGSALGATAVDMALAGFLRLGMPRPKGAMRLLVADNPDPRFFGQMLEGLDLERTAFNVVSKSGSTAETMSQYLVVRKLLETKLGPEQAKERLVFTTDPEKGNLRPLAKAEGIAALSVPPNVGGRYSVLTAVGLLPLACAGHDVRALLAGAGEMAARCAAPDIMANPAQMFAALTTHYMAAGRNILVMMPYATDLFGLGQWFAQLWAESLGKKTALTGETVHAGQTPVAAVGATDQHSQLQLYIEGPQDKLVCFITTDDYGRDLEIPGGHAGLEGLAYLGGKTMGQLIKAEAMATAAALAGEGRPSLGLRLPAIGENSLGQVLFLLEAATVMAGSLLNIDPLDQPGVELGKKLTYGLMGREGFEDDARRMESLDLGGKFLV